MVAGVQGNRQGRGLVVYFIAVGTVFVAGVIVRQAGAQAGAFAQRQGPVGAHEVAIIEVFGFCTVQRDAEVVVEAVGTASVGQVLVFTQRAIGFAGVVHLAAISQATGFDEQTVDGAVGDAVALVVVRQQTGVVVVGNRVFRQMDAIAYNGVFQNGDFHSAADFRIFILG